MEPTARLFNCARCHCQVLICSACDRGNIYCGSRCASAARRTSLRAAGNRYQSSRRGRFTHAARQERYRGRQRDSLREQPLPEAVSASGGDEKVTHQGSVPAPPDGVLPPTSQTATARPPQAGEVIRCAFCGRGCSPRVRLDFIRRGSGTRRGSEPTWSWPARARSP